MLRRSFLKQTAALAGLSIPLRAAVSRRPNVLVLFAGQWRGQNLPGIDQDLQAPSLERLAREGTHFTRAYTCCPQSAPARAGLLTGRFPHANGVMTDELQLPIDQSTFAERLRSSGYRTGFIGKWNLDGAGDPGFVPPGPRRHGFDYWAAFNRGERFYNSRYFRDTPEPLRRPGYEPDYQTDLAIDFLRERGTRPFLLFVSWGPPHPPRNPPEHTGGDYRPAAMHLRGNVPDELQPRVQADYAAYDALCTSIDHNAERLLNELDEANLSSNTIVVFTSDHGDMLGSHGIEDRDVPYEEAVRIPLLLRYPPAVGRAKQENGLVSIVDLAPTLLALCGESPLEGGQGQDLVPVLSNSAARSGQEAVFAEGKLNSSGEWRMVVRGLDKLVLNRNMETTHLFNLGLDPFEMENLATDPAHQLRRDELKALIAAWMRRTEYKMDASGLKKRS